MNTQEKLLENFEFVQKNKPSLLNLYRGKYILVHEKEVVSSFDTYEAAAEAGVKNFGINGDFLVYEMFETEPLNFLMLAQL
jgi:hypothetical protein